MGAFDTSMYSQNPLRSVADYEGDYQKQALAQQAMQQNALALKTGEMGLEEKQRELASANALRDVGMSFGKDPQANAMMILQKTGDIKAAQAYMKSVSDQAKVAEETRGEAVKTKGMTDKQQRDAITFNLQQLSTVNNPQGYAAWLDGGVKSGLMSQQEADAQKAQIPQTPTEFAALKQQQMLAGVDLAKQFDIRAAAARDAEQARQFGVTDARVKSEGAANRGVTMRGQNMTDARSRESTSAVMSKPFEVTGADGAPVLVQQDKQGNITPVQGFGPKSGASKPLNDSQAKALLFGSRMQEAEKALNSLDGKYSPAAINAKVSAENTPFIGGLAGMAGNAMLSDEGQQAEQAQRDFINAVLRRESGAAISASEFENARKQYFPQPNDKAGNLAQKKANRELAIKGLLAEVPEGQRRSLSQPESSPHPSDINALLKKYGK